MNKGTFSNVMDGTESQNSPKSTQLTGNKKASKPTKEGIGEAKKSSAIETNIAVNIAILQNEEIAELRSTPPYSRTFRFLEKEIIWLEDEAHKLSKKMPGNKKITQTDLIRLAIKLFAVDLKEQPGDIETILKAIKQ